MHLAFRHSVLTVEPEESRSLWSLFGDLSLAGNLGAKISQLRIFHSDLELRHKTPLQHEQNSGYHTGIAVA